MLRSSTSSILQRRKGSSDKGNYTILRSSHNIPKYQDTWLGGIDNNNNNMNGYPEENRVGNFNVLNENNHPGVVYYFIQVTNPEENTSGSADTGGGGGGGSSGNNGHQNRNVNGSS